MPFQATLPLAKGQQLPETDSEPVGGMPHHACGEALDPQSGPDRRALIRYDTRTRAGHIAQTLHHDAPVRQFDFQIDIRRRQARGPHQIQFMRIGGERRGAATSRNAQPASLQAASRSLGPRRAASRAGSMDSKAMAKSYRPASHRYWIRAANAPALSRTSPRQDVPIVSRRLAVFAIRVSETSVHARRNPRIPSRQGARRSGTPVTAPRRALRSSRGRYLPFLASSQRSQWMSIDYLTTRLVAWSSYVPNLRNLDQPLPGTGSKSAGRQHALHPFSKVAAGCRNVARKYSHLTRTCRSRKPKPSSTSR